MKESLTRHAVLIGALLVIGAGWGLTMPLTKIAVSEGYRPFGLIFWQLVITSALMTSVTLLRGKPLPFSGTHLRFYLLITLIGAVIPNSITYTVATKLPAGILSILLSTVPLYAFLIAIALGMDSFGRMRALGLLLGLGGVLLILGPEASLPERAMVVFIPLALISPLFYGLEGNVIARWGAYGLDPVQILAGASLLGIPLALVLALSTGQWIDPRGPWAAPDLALIASSVIHSAVYSGYFWMVMQAGPVFAAQVSYLITGFGVVWAMTLLGETYSGYIWGALGLLMMGLFLVQPRPRIGLAPAARMGKYEPAQERGKNS